MLLHATFRSPACRFPLFCPASSAPARLPNPLTPRCHFLRTLPSRRDTMQQVATLAQAGRMALDQRKLHVLAVLMSRNFRLRRQLYGDAVVGAQNLAMVATAESVGAAGKLTGSGGAVVALCPEGAEQAERLQAACAAAGFECVPVQVGPALHHA